MDDRIWNELQQAKKNHFYCIYLAAYKRQILNVYNVCLIIFSAGGAMGWKIWQNPEVAGIACAIIAITTLLKQMELHIIPSEKEISKLDTVINFYFDYNNKLEKLWLDLFSDRISEQNAKDAFYNIKDTEKSTCQLINEVVKWHNRRINKRAEGETVKYITSIFNC